MNLKQRFILFIALSVTGLILLIISGITCYAYLLSPEQFQLFQQFLSQHLWVVVLPPTLLLLLLGWTVFWYGEHFLGPLNKITEDTGILVVNPAHRVALPRSRPLQQLARSINSTADHFEALRLDTESRVEQGRATLAEEKNILTTLIAKLNEGVLVCNQDCNIILYNARAEHFYMRYGSDNDDNTYGSMIGLGRSILGIFDPRLVQHALQDMRYRLSRNDGEMASQFISPGSKNHLLRVQLAPILDQGGEMHGFIMVLYDITDKVRRDGQRDMLLQSLTEGIRITAAGIRTAIETILDNPTMDAKQRSAFQRTIHEESLQLSELIEKTTHDFYAHAKAPWPLENMLCEALLWGIQRTATDKLPIQLTIDDCEDGLRVNVDSYSLVQAYYFMMHELNHLLDIDRFRYRITRKNNVVCIDLVWKNQPLSRQSLQEWRKQFLMIENEGVLLTLQEVLDRHNAELRSKADPQSGDNYLRLHLPLAPEPPEKRPRINIETESRPEFYDFDLFNRKEQTTALDNDPLSQLTYTIFDTETTGLNPSGGDEIISIGAVRIVNQRMLRREVFEQLVDPRRALSRASIKIHGISPEILKSQPTIDRVLPAFHDYAKDTVLVAHNAAFDMRFLQVKEDLTGVRFDNPILDTLLLSAFVHPHQGQHSLDAIARRLGIDIIGRHTALGDSLATAEIFLKLIPLLAKKGVHTLNEARLAARQTYYARITY